MPEIAPIAPLGADRGTSTVANPPMATATGDAATTTQQHSPADTAPAGAAETNQATAGRVPTRDHVDFSALAQLPRVLAALRQAGPEAMRTWLTQLGFSTTSPQTDAVVQALMQPPATDAAAGRFLEILLSAAAENNTGTGGTTPLPEAAEARREVLQKLLVALETSPATTPNQGAGATNRPAATQTVLQVVALQLARGLQADPEIIAPNTASPAAGGSNPETATGAIRLNDLLQAGAGQLQKLLAALTTLGNGTPIATGSGAAQPSPTTPGTATPATPGANAPNTPSGAANPTPVAAGSLPAAAAPVLDESVALQLALELAQALSTMPEADSKQVLALLNKPYLQATPDLRGQLLTGNLPTEEAIAAPPGKPAPNAPAPVASPTPGATGATHATAGTQAAKPHELATYWRQLTGELQTLTTRLVAQGEPEAAARVTQLERWLPQLERLFTQQVPETVIRNLAQMLKLSPAALRQWPLRGLLMPLPLSEQFSGAETLARADALQPPLARLEQVGKQWQLVVAPPQIEGRVAEKLDPATRHAMPAAAGGVPANAAQEGAPRAPLAAGSLAELLARGEARHAAGSDGQQRLAENPPQAQREAATPFPNWIPFNPNPARVTVPPPGVRRRDRIEPDEEEAGTPEQEFAGTDDNRQPEVIPITDPARLLEYKPIEVLRPAQKPGEGTPDCIEVELC